MHPGGHHHKIAVHNLNLWEADAWAWFKSARILLVGEGAEKPSEHNPEKKRRDSFRLS